MKRTFHIVVYTIITLSVVQGCSKIPNCNAIVSYGVNCSYTGEEDNDTVTDYANSLLTILKNEIGKVHGLSQGREENTFFYKKCSERVLPGLIDDIVHYANEASNTMGPVPSVSGKLNLTLYIYISFDDSTSRVWEHRINYPQMYY